MTANRFLRPIVCTWCGNRYRIAVPFESRTRGFDCAASVYQVTEEYLARVRALQESRRFTATQRASYARVSELPLGMWLVKAHYGSTSYDTSLFRFVQNAPTESVEPICDNCIGERHLAGDLERIDGHFP